MAVNVNTSACLLVYAAAYLFLKRVASTYGEHLRSMRSDNGLSV